MGDAGNGGSLPESMTASPAAAAAAVVALVGRSRRLSLDPTMPHTALGAVEEAVRQRRAASGERERSREASAGGGGHDPG